MRKTSKKIMEPRTEKEASRTTLQRRDFFRLMGGGGLLFILRPWEGIANASESTQRQAPKQDYNAFLHIAEDGTVTCYTGKIEMGQGIITSLPQMMADELNVPIGKIKMVMGDTDLCPYDAGTWGSLTTRIFGVSMRKAAAEAKMVLVGMAAEKLGVPQSQLEVKDGIVTDLKNPKNKVAYSDLTRGQRIEKFLDVKPSVEEAKKFTYIGKAFKKADSIEKVTGSAKYTGDLKLPGMLFARILRPPSHGASLISANTTEAEKIPGIRVVRDGDFIAVLHENYEVAGEALSKITAKFKFDEKKVNDKTISEYLLNAQPVSTESEKNGDIEAGRKQSDFVFESQFADGYLAHTPIETHTALAKFENGKVTFRD